MNSFRDYGRRRESASKDEILRHWSSLTPTGPIGMQPRPEKYRGSGLGHDTIRVSGSQKFIDSVLARLKDVLSYQSNPHFELNVSMDDAPRRANNASSFVFYCSLKQRSH